MEEVIAKLEQKWGRTIYPYTENICAMYAKDALTGWVLLLMSPTMVEFNGTKCIGVSVAAWVMLKTLGSETVTPFRIVAKGKGLVEKAFMPHTGLKYAVRDVEGTPVVHIPVSDFKSV